MEQKLVPAPAPRLYWPSTPPAGCPFEASKDLFGLEFTGRHAEYANADTWYPSWASDGNLYSPWTDGSVNGVSSGSGGKGATTGYATIVGDDPLNLKVINPGVFRSDPSPYAGRYPCGSLVDEGVWYYGTYCLHPSGSVPHDGMTYNWPWLGPFVGFRWSTDSGKTWTQTPCTPDRPLFGESSLHGEPVKIGTPHFVDFGKNMEHSPDGKAYLVAHGASDGVNRRFAYDSWITGDEIYLIRVKPSIENINDASKYEFFAGNDRQGEPLWSSDFAKIKPIAAWKDNMGCVTMTYDAPLKRYLLCVTDGTNTVGYFNTYILESTRMTGPWKLVDYLRRFGEQAYFVNFPSKFIGPDGRTLWLCYAANFSQGWNGVRFKSSPVGGRYGMCLQEVKLLDTLQAPASISVLDGSSNVARTAVVTASSTYKDYSPRGAIDGVVGGYPGDNSNEWASNGESTGAWLRLAWDRDQTVDRVWLFDRPNSLDQVISGTLSFSDGSSISTGELPDVASKGLEIKFPARQINWLKFTVTGTKPGTQNIGLSEIAVFAATAAGSGGK